MDRIEIYQEIRSMKITYIFHFVFYTLLGVEHLLMILKIFWSIKIHIKLFISCSIIDLLFLFYPIIPLVLMYHIILKKNLTKIFKILSLLIIIFSLVIGIIINVFFWLNLKETTSFSKECPYNINDTKLFIDDENPSERCNKRRCILESINLFEGYPYNYICNYNSQNEFEIEPNKQYPIKLRDGSTYYLKYYIQCEKKGSIDELFFDKNNINDQNELYIYLQKCWNNNDIKGFYLCQRYELHNKFNVDENFNCPKDNYNVILYLSGIFLIVLDIILAFIPWSLDYKSYSKIISFDNNENENLGLENNENNNDQQRRHNETNTSSNNPNLNNAEGNNNQNGNVNENNNNQNNNNNVNNERNNENDFIRQPTETIIIAKNNISSNMKSSDRLNSGLNSNNENSKSIVNSNNNKRKNKNGKDNNIVNSMISKSESQNMISKTSQKENESEDSKIEVNKKLLLKKNNDNKSEKNKNNEFDDINFNNIFNNDIRYDEYKNNDEEDEKEENKNVKNSCLIQNKNINIYKNTKKNKKKIYLQNNETDEGKDNINIKETNNSVRTTIGKKHKEENLKNNKNNDNSVNNPKIDNLLPITENINGNYRNKTPKKEIKSLNFNFSQVLTNIRDSDQVTLFNNTNGSIIKEERKEETEKSLKEEEKNNYNLSANENKRQNLSFQTSFKKNKKSKSKEKQEEIKCNSMNKIKNESQSSLLIDNSVKSDNNMHFKEDNKSPNNLINFI